MNEEIIIYSPVTFEDYEAVKKVFIEYQEFLNVDLCFQNFDKELNNLAAIYQAPKGVIFLAKIRNEVVGCVALKPIEINNCEMKRLYVKPEYRGKNIGKQFIEKLLKFAKEQKYDKMKLDTLTTLTEALKLYKNYSFTETKPYVYNPLSNVLYFEKDLQNI